VEDSHHSHAHAAAARHDPDEDEGLRVVVNNTSISTPDGASEQEYERSAQEQPELTASGYCLIDENCQVLEPAGAERSRMVPDYIDIFEQRPDVNVISFWHGIATDALATQQRQIPITLELVNANILSVPVIDVGGTPEDSWDDVRRWIGEEISEPVINDDANAVVMTVFAALTVAENFLELERRIRAIERSAWSVLMGAEAIPSQWAALMGPSTANETAS
jgi:hypothetical protein